MTGQQRRKRMAVAALALSLIGLPGCSHRGEQSPPARSGGGSLPTAACRTASLKPEDLAGILNAPIILATPVPGDVQSCAYLTEGFPSITISVRRGVGKSTLDAWEHGKMPFEALPITGVGEAALWQSGLRELIARQGELLCDVQVRAGANDLALDPAALPAAAGGLCNKIFAVPR